MLFPIHECWALGGDLPGGFPGLQVVSRIGHPREFRWHLVKDLGCWQRQRSHDDGGGVGARIEGLRPDVDQGGWFEGKGEGMGKETKEAKVMKCKVMR